MLHNITNYPTTGTERAYTDVAACYDYNDSLHILWTGCWYDSAAGLVSADANLYHWSKATGTDMIAPGYWDDATPGAWNRNISKMSICAKDPIYHPGGNPDSVYLFATWTQFNPNDLSLGGFTNGEIYAAVSKDGGNTWGFTYNLTNTETPDCQPGQCLSEHWSSLAKNMAEGDLHISYVCDRDAGGIVQDEGAYTANPMMYLHVQQLPCPSVCGFTYTYVEPASFDKPPVKVSPTTPRIVRFNVQGIYTIGGNYQVTDNHAKVSVAPAGQFSLNPGESQEIQVTINCGGSTEFVNAKLSIHGCIGSPPPQDTTVDLTLYAVCSNDYYECDRDPLTDIVKDNCKLKLWACVNCEEVVWDKRVQLNDPEDTHQVIFTAGAIIATTAGSDTIVGRQDYRDIYTGARDTINHVQSTIAHPLEEPECIIQKIHVKNTYIWYPKVINPTTSDIRWWWIDLHKQIIFFEDRPPAECPEWKKEQVIKYYWITQSNPPAWWPTPGTYPGHEDIYFGVFADIDAPSDTGCYVDGSRQLGCNPAGWDGGRKLIYQSGYWNGYAAPNGHPDYANHYVGMALTDPTGAVVSPYGMQDVRNDSFLYPNQNWGWKDGELYELAATPGANIHDPSVVCNRSVVMTAKKINAADPIPAEFILIEASITTGLAALQTHIDETRSVLVPELNTLGLFNKQFPICGDVTSDGVINSADVVGLTNYLYNPAHPLPKWPMNRADVTGDKQINSADVIGLLNYLYNPAHPKLNCSGFGR